ncbi:Oidioi.mRNA.OKI2018_I69.chr2.g5875.t1.cds [Oikopleura dioica]|uniref:Oidioi.mRNA.OKI2018_I69.chr2.g5875.t1.cds n=1 Tax=Oikopleura dioica TaxID=34765 RepID=A0ABN7T4W0_OIKDI|nr:Oidioi.mRNA.OKI2018_I69.chr2.g5875.t1.cds [Oikopleura dioica]
MMKFLTLLCSFAYAEEDAVSNIHVGSPSYIKTPKYPADMPTQAQYSWTVTADPGFNIKIEFEDFSIPVSPNCKIVFLSITTDSADWNMTGNRFCGQHPKVFITNGSSATLYLRADSDPNPLLPKRFKLKVSKTRERASTYAPNAFAGKIEKTSVARIPSPRSRVPVVPNQLPNPAHRASAGVFGGSHNMANMAMHPAPQPVAPRPAIAAFPRPAPYGPAPIPIQQPVPVQIQNQQPVPILTQNSGVAPIQPVGQQNEKLLNEKEEKKSLSLIIPVSLLVLAVLLGASAFLIKKFLRDD